MGMGGKNPSISVFIKKKLVKTESSLENPRFENGIRICKCTKTNQYDKFTGIGSQELKAKILHVFIFTNHNNTPDKKFTITHKKTQKLFPQKKLKSLKVIPFL
jgi:hypothetical protein